MMTFSMLAMILLAVAATSVATRATGTSAAPRRAGSFPPSTLDMPPPVFDAQLPEDESGQATRQHTGPALPQQPAAPARRSKSARARPGGAQGRGAVAAMLLG